MVPSVPSGMLFKKYFPLEVIVISLNVSIFNVTVFMYSIMEEQ